MARHHNIRLTIRTPHAIVFQTDARSLRVLTETGQVGVRPGMEPSVLALEAGLALVHTEEGTRIVGTAGGLLLSTRNETTLLTPLAIVGSSREDIARQLQGLLEEPNEEMQARTQLGKLEERILDQMRNEGVTPADRGRPRS